MTIQAILISVSNAFLKPAVPILIGLALVVFLWGLVKYLYAGFGDVKKIEEARNLMIWGVISLTVMVSVWGLVKIVQDTFFKGANLTTPPAIPYFGGGGASIPESEPQEPPPSGDNVFDYRDCPGGRCDFSLPSSDSCSCFHI